MTVPATEQFSNNFATTLSAAIASTTRPVTFTVTSATGAPPGPQFAVMIDAEELMITAGGSGTTTWTGTTATGSTAATHLLGAFVTHELTTRTVQEWLPSFNHLPRSNNYLAWTYDPVQNVSSTAPTAGVAYYCKIPIPYLSCVVTNIHLAVITAGATLTNCFGGLFSSAGTLLSATADQSAVWTSTGVKTMALTTAQTLAGGPDVFVWAAFLVGTGTTIPLFSRSSGVNFLNNAGCATSALRYGSAGAALSALPGTVTPTAMVSVGAAYWMALS